LRLAKCIRVKLLDRSIPSSSSSRVGGFDDTIEELG
jgi:hypothetical protein